MNRIVQVAAPALVAVFAVGCGDPFFVEVEAPRVCDVTQALAFETVELPPEVAAFYASNPQLAQAQLPSATMKKTLEYKLAGALGQDMVDNIETNVILQQVKFLSVTGSSLSFVKDIEVSIVSPDSGAAPQKLLSYHQDPKADPASLTELTANESDEPIDIRQYATGDSIILDTALTGTWPREGATMDVGACVGLSARTNYLDAL